MKQSVLKIENEEVRNEVIRLLEIFDEGFLNYEFELVICHPIKIRPRFSKYCNVYFRTDNCQTKKDVQCKVLEWWSRDASKTVFGSERTSNFVHYYIRKGINAYLGTNFSDIDMHDIYNRLGNAIHHDLTIKFIDSGFDMGVLE